MEFSIAPLFIILYALSVNLSEVGGKKSNVKKCTEPKGFNGDFHTDGCIRQTCKNGVWRPSLEETVCCYDREAYSPNTTIIATTAQDGCTTSSIECRLDGSKAKMIVLVENNCQKPASQNTVEALQEILEKHMADSGSSAHSSETTTMKTMSWLNPPVQSHLKVYVFHVTNPEAVMHGEKPILEEIGPFTYKSVTVKDSVDKVTGKENLKFNEDGETLTYRPRTFYFLDRNQSVGDPDTTFITIPNIPLLTGFSKIRDMAWTKGIATNIILKSGLGTPFINVSLTGLLWGYHDELPCLKLTRPAECRVPEAEVDTFADDGDYDEWGDNDDWKRKKRSAGRFQKDTEKDLKNVDFESMQKPKAEIVDCKCEWGLFRDRNITLREAVKMHHGMADLSKKGWVEEFNSSPNMNWWQPGSACDKVGGHDGATLPPGIMRTDVLDIFFPSFTRRINLEYEKDVEHLGLPSYRFIPPSNALGSHNDPDSTARNPVNSCYCLDGFSCFKSGVLNLEPSKRRSDLPRGEPMAISFPHFYQADPSFLSAVSGLSPDKNKHQLLVDVAPESGLPLAIRQRFQLNAIIRKDEDIPMMSNFVDELVLPFLWTEDGLSEQSEEMAEKIKFDL